jgi:hypothetical protein
MQDLVFLLDVDNTLLDFDGVLGDLRRRLVDDLGTRGPSATGAVSSNCATSSATPTTWVRCSAIAWAGPATT